MSAVVIAGTTATSTVSTTTASTTTTATDTGQTTTAETTAVTTTATTTTATLPGGDVVPADVRVAGVDVGGLSPAAAVTAVQAAFAQPLPVVVNRHRLELDPTRFATAYAALAVAKARASASRTKVALTVNVNGPALRRWVALLGKRFDRASVDATLSLVKGRPRVSPDRVGRRLDTNALTRGLVAALSKGSRAPVRVHTRAIAPNVRTAAFGPVIVINRSLNRLQLYNGKRLVRVFGVATGQAIYPTPKGTFHVIVKWRNPWWYPPTQDAWAQGLQPVPPGPSNPLGTRWMGLSAPGVGIHGTDEPASIGYSASHGCIRMQVPDAEWLFDRVNVGTTVFIL